MHNIRDIKEICDRILFLHDGKILAEGTATQITEQFQSLDLDEVFVRISRNQIDTLQPQPQADSCADHLPFPTRPSA